MKASFTRLIPVALCVFVGSLCSRAADEPETKTNMKEVLRAKMAEEAKKKAPAPATPPTAGADQKSEQAAPAAPASTPAAKDEKTAAKPGDQPATVMPKVE